MGRACHDGAKLANRLAAFRCFQRNLKLVCLPVSPPFLDHRIDPPQAGGIAPLYPLARSSAFGAKLIQVTLVRVREPFLTKQRIVVE